MPVYKVSNGKRARQIVGREVLDVANSVLPLLNEAVQFSRGEFTALDLLSLVCQERCQLWVTSTEKSVMVTELADYPQKRVCRIVAVAGSLADFNDIADAMRLWAAANGAVEVEAYCRPAVARLARRYGFLPTRREQIVLPIKEMWQ